MKKFTDYLLESAKKYEFRIKVAGDVTAAQVATMKELLGKFNLDGFKKVGKTPIQTLPLDFPKIKNAEVCIYDITLDYPTTSWELHEYLSMHLGITKDAIVVRKPGEPSEQYQVTAEKRETALLSDPNYTESPNAQFEDYYGDKYNSGFVKELNDILKLQRKARGEEIPTPPEAVYNTDTEANTASILKQAEKVRK